MAASSTGILLIVVFLACALFPVIISVVAFCMMMRMSEDIRWLRFKDDPTRKKPMQYTKIIVCCFAVSVILAVLLSSPFIAAMSSGVLNLPSQSAATSTLNR